jgi:RNA polymerase sigma factor (sigma-70 family)
VSRCGSRCCRRSCASCRPSWRRSIEEHRYLDGWTIRRIEELARQPHVTLVWPTHSAIDSSLRERLLTIERQELVPDPRLLDIYWAAVLPQRIDIPFGTSETLDGPAGRDVTLRQKILSTPITILLRNRIPLVRKLAGKVRRACSLEDSHFDDLVQEGWQKVYEKLHLFHGRSSFDTWVWAVAKNAMLDYARRVNRVRAHERTIGAADDTGVEPDFSDSYLTRRVILEALRDVPDSELLLYQALGYQDAEISDENLRMRRRRARLKLREALDDDDLVLSA